jgi:hypothetical protein
MRFQLTLIPDSPSGIIPVNYQYPVSPLFINSFSRLMRAMPVSCITKDINSPPVKVLSFSVFQI